MSKKKNNTKHSQNKENTKSKSTIFLILAVIIIIACIAIFCLMKKQTFLFPLNAEKEQVEVEEIANYELYVDESGNEIRTDIKTGESTIVLKEDLPIPDEEESARLESESIKKQEEYDIIKSELDEKYEAGDIDDEKYDELLNRALESQVAFDENEVRLHNVYDVIIDKKIFMSANQQRFMQEMTFLFDDFNALVNLDNDSYYNEDSDKVILYVSEFDDKDYDDIKERFVKAFGTTDFTFEKNNEQ